MNDITIYNADGTPLMSNVPITENAVHEENLMQTDQVNLKWNAAGGYIDSSKPNLINVSELEIGGTDRGQDSNYLKYRYRTPFAKKISVTGGAIYSFRFFGFGNKIGCRFIIELYDANGDWISSTSWMQVTTQPNYTRVFTLPNGVAYMRFLLSFSASSTTVTTNSTEDTTQLTLDDRSNLKVMLIEGNTAPDMWYPSEAEEAAKHPTLPAGSFITLNRIRYYLAEDYRPDSKDLGLYTYTLEFLHEVYLLKKMPFLLINATNNGNSIESDWNYTGSLADLCQPLEQAINDALGIDGASLQAYSVQIDAAIENAVSLSFSNMSILDALNAIAEAVNGEWYTDEAINGYTGNHIIHIAPSCLHEGGESSTLAFTAGNQVGFPQSQQKHEFYNRYYIFGSTRNIPQDYNGAQVNTVVNKRLTLDPTLHPNGYIDLPQFTEEGEVVTTDDSTKPSFYDENGNVAHYVPDDSLSGRKFVKVVQIDDVYPRANLHVSSIVANTRYVLRDGNKVQTGTDGGGNPVYSTYVVYYVSLQNESNEAFTIDDSTYDPTSNPNGNRIKGLNVSIHFKSGALTGREFEVKYHSAASQQENIDGTKVNVPAGAFEIVFIEDNTVIIPNTNIAPVVDDEVTVFNIRMPQAYITSAYKELDKEAMKAIYEEWRDGNEYEVKSNPESFTQNVYNLHIGRHVKLTAWGRLIDTRITKLQTHLDRDFEQTISFTKGIKKGTISTLLTTIEATSARMTQVELKDDSNLQQLRQQLYTAQRELHDMVFDTEGNYYSDKISPVAIETKLIEVGGKSTQLSVSGLTVMPNVNSALTAKDPDHVKVVSNSGKLVHYGLPESPRTWNISNNEIDLANANAYYIYARCVRAEGATACAIVCDQTQYVYNEDETYYYFLIGTISSKISNGDTPPSYDRVVSLMYGSTSISGRFVTTGRIQSVDGNTWFDLDTGELHGDFTFTAAQREELAADAASRVQVGGRNYLLNSDGSSSAKITLHGNATLATLDGVKCVKADQNTTSCGFYVSTSQMSSAINGNTTDAFDWVLSVDVYASAANIDCQWGFGYGERETITTVGAWHRLTKTVKSSLKTFVVYKVNNNGTLYFKNWKLERGNVATDWTPAPEDETQAMADLANSLEGLETQLDSKIDTWFDTYEPTTSNAPASGWSSTEKTEHTDDLFYNTDTGNVYRWTGSVWEKLEDSKIQVALNNASTAQATADGKMTVFTSTPSNYKRGDMWVQGANGDILYATTDSTTYNASHWVNASKYTDDTVANQAKDMVNNLQIGGRNLLAFSDLKGNTSKTGKGLTWTQEANGWISVSGTVTGSSDGLLNFWGTGSSSEIFAADDYVMSVENDGLLTQTIRLQVGLSSGYQYFDDGGSAIITKSIGRICLLIPASATGMVISGKVRLKLEKGNKATDWTPAPEDVNSAISTAQAAANGAQAAIDSMNGDTTFSIIEKKAFRPQWKEISGYDNTTSTPTTSTSVGGSYEKALKAASGTSVSTSALTTAFGNLRTYLDDKELWENSDTTNFSQSTLGTLTKEYYDAETALYNALADYYAQQESAKAINLVNLLDDSRVIDTNSAVYDQTTAEIDRNYSQDGVYTYIPYADKRVIVTFPTLSIGEVYTFSFYYTRPWGASVPLVCTIGSDSISVDTIRDTYWRRLTITFTASSSTVKAEIYPNVSSGRNMAFRWFQLEKNATATPWGLSVADQSKVDSQRYLSDALAEAKNAPATMKGGLILGSFIGVQDSSQNVVAGMVGTQAANEGNMPMLFAGRVPNTNEQGTFRVWKDGLIESVSNDQNYKVQLDDSSFVFLVKNGSNYDLRNVIKSQLASSISGMLSDSNLADGSGTITGKSSDGIIRTNQRSVYYGAGGADGSMYYTMEPLSHAALDDVVSIPMISANTFANIARINLSSFTIDIALNNSTYQSYPTPPEYGRWFSVTKSGNFSGTITVKLNGSVYFRDDVTAATTITVPANSFVLPAKAALTMTVILSGSFTDGQVHELMYNSDWGAYMDDQGNFNRLFTFIRSATYSFSTSSFTWTAGQSARCNQFYANGLLMANNSYCYIGMLPDADPMMQIMAKQYHGLKMTKNNGLAFQQGSSSWYHLNPLALIVRVTWNNSQSKYDKTIIYNPRGITPSVDKDGDNCRITHGLGTSNYSVNVVLRNNAFDARRGGVQVNIQNNYVVVNVGDYSNTWRADFDIFFYDYSTL